MQGVRKSIDQSWLAKGLGLGLLSWGFKGVQKEIPSEEASTLQIRSVAFPPGQCTSPQLHPCYRLFEQDGHQDSYSPCDFCLFPKLKGCHYETIEERLWRRSLTHSHKRTSMGPCRSSWNGTSALQLEEITSKGTRVLCVNYQLKCPYEKSLETYRMHLVFVLDKSTWNYWLLWQCNGWLWNHKA